MSLQVTLASTEDLDVALIAELLSPAYRVEQGSGLAVNGIPVGMLVVTRKERK